jgi:hypothetical protein
VARKAASKNGSDWHAETQNPFHPAKQWRTEMSCSCTFTPATVPSNSDPNRHVNFSTGMVLGVEDYRQEFAYHSARDKWIIRDIAGYGTLSGLGVALDDTDPAVPKLRVGMGTAAAPSGQLICVGADQCAQLNDWLKRADVVLSVTGIDTARTPVDQARIKTWLTLCYTNCEVAPVPIPGQPCRSEADLMAPSRVADDYRLSLSFDPPAIGETDYLRLLEQFRWAIPVGGAAPTLPQTRELMRRIRAQAKALFAPMPGPVDPLDMVALQVHATVIPDMIEVLRNVWITDLRPQIVPLPCGPSGAATDDCVSLATLTLDVVKNGAVWEVVTIPAGGFEIDIDQSDRPFVQSLALANSAFALGPVAAPTTLPQMAILTADGTIDAATDLALIRNAVAATPLAISITGGGTNRPRRRLYVRNLGDAEVTLSANSSGVIDGALTKLLAPGAFAYLAYDGAGNWFSRAGR